MRCKCLLLPKAGSARSGEPSKAKALFWFRNLCAFSHNADFVLINRGTSSPSGRGGSPATQLYQPAPMPVCERTWLNDDGNRAVFFIAARNIICIINVGSA